MSNKRPFPLELRKIFNQNITTINFKDYITMFHLLTKLGLQMIMITAELFGINKLQSISESGGQNKVLMYDFERKSYLHRDACIGETVCYLDNY